MEHNKNAKKSMGHRWRLLGLLLVGAASFLMLAGGTAYADDPPAGKYCPAGTYSKAANKCVSAPDASGKCPTGLKPDGTVPAPNNCTTALADGTQEGPVRFTTGYKGKYTCGNGNQVVHISINIGCAGEKGNISNPIVDIGFAIARFLSIGAGLVIIGSIVLAGVQYSTAKGDPKAAGDAMKRIRSSLYALLIFIFAAAILDFLIPVGFFR